MLSVPQDYITQWLTLPRAERDSLSTDTLPLCFSVSVRNDSATAAWWGSEALCHKGKSISLSNEPLASVSCQAQNLRTKVRDFGTKVKGLRSLGPRGFSLMRRRASSFLLLSMSRR